MEMMRVPATRGEWAMTTSRPASKPKVIRRSSPYSKRPSSNVTQGPENTCAASSKLRPCFTRFCRFFASSHSYFISECSSFCSYKQAFPLRGVTAYHRSNATRLTGPYSALTRRSRFSCREDRLVGKKGPRKTTRSPQERRKQTRTLRPAKGPFPGQLLAESL